ncbi:hypothetical protein [Kibdelosporangium phytohabitans]|uniref:Uncharacterized protein n=1 Tax=Kibdelosporangium phytohabitans TaxID=860235 RepID=A0A0N9HW19_9PSEU|nr:hypothetical protein [Kibdelosporangium phytohabitans]ALG06164.1 hypothetical protein AOZ06_03815 [Kibdelosporangium phytohabitans]MBE1465741.1 hypothetical protein [Kibdelosporangium phytohabitans]
MIDRIADLRARAQRATSVLPLVTTVFGAAILGEAALVLGLWCLGVDEPAAGPYVPSDFYWPLVVPFCLAVVIHRGRRQAAAVGATYRHTRVALVIAATVCLTAVAPLVALVLDQRVSIVLPGGDPGALLRCVLALGLLVLASLERRWGTAVVAVVASGLTAGLWLTTASLHVTGTKAELLPLFASVVAAHLIAPGLMLLSSSERRAVPA